MIQLTPQMRILVAVEPVDFRNYAVTAVMRSRRRLTQHQVQLESHAGGPRMTRNSA